MNRWLIIFEDGGEVVRQSLQDAQQTVEDHGRGGIIVPMMPADDACHTFAAQHAMAAIDALCCYAKGRVAKARKRQYSSDSAEIQTAIDRADYVLSHAEGIKAMLAAAPQPQAEDAHTQAWWDGYHSAMRLFDAPAPQPQPQPQASAEDLALVGRYVTAHKSLKTDLHDAWQRIRADYERMGVGK